MKVDIKELSPQAISESLVGFKRYCSLVKAQTSDESLINDSMKQEESIDGLLRVWEHWFVNEGISEEQQIDPSRELYRKPFLQDSCFDNDPLFLIGHRRSGTTLINYILNASENIAALPENWFATNIAVNIGIQNTLLRVSQSLNQSYPMLLLELAKIINNSYLEYAKRNGKTRWISKEVFAEDCLDTLDSLFDYRAKYVYVVRHGLDVAWSCVLRFETKLEDHHSNRQGMAISRYLDTWVKNNQLTMDFYERNSERCYFLRYEDFVENPIEESRKLYNFVGENWSPNLIDEWGNQNVHGLGDNKIHKTKGQIIRKESAWLNWPKGLISTLARTANPTLERLGYSTI